MANYRCPCDWGFDTEAEMKEHQAGVNGCSVAKVYAERDALLLQLRDMSNHAAALRVCLLKWGVHHDDCNLRTHGTPFECTCGLEANINRIPGDPTDADRLNGEYREALGAILDQGCRCHLASCVCGFDIADKALAKRPNGEVDCGCLVGSHFWDCRKATNAERSSALLKLFDDYSSEKITLSRLAEILSQSPPVLRASIVKAGKLMSGSLSNLCPICCKSKIAAPDIFCGSCGEQLKPPPLTVDNVLKEPEKRVEVMPKLDPAAKIGEGCPNCCRPILRCVCNRPVFNPGSY